MLMFIYCRKIYLIFNPVYRGFFISMEKIKEDLKKQLMRHEGLRLHPYRCTEGYLTIGVGRNLDGGISEKEAMMFLENDLQECEAELNRVMPWWTEQPQEIQQVLLNMIFNLGAPSLMGFRKFLTFLQEKQYDTAATEMLDSKWSKQVGSRSIELSEMVRKCQ